MDRFLWEVRCSNSIVVFFEIKSLNFFKVCLKTELWCVFFASIFFFIVVVVVVVVVIEPAQVKEVRLEFILGWLGS